MDNYLCFSFQPRASPSQDSRSSCVEVEYGVVGYVTSQAALIFKGSQKWKGHGYQTRNCSRLGEVSVYGL